MSGAPEISSQPGLILRTAREELGFSLDHVAHELHLRVSVVQSLENEDYSAFTSDVFLKGYFRSYCRLVNLHEERMVELLEKQLLLIKQEHDDQAANDKKAAQAKVRKKAGVLVALIAVVSSVLIYLFSVFGDTGEAISPDVHNLNHSLLKSQQGEIADEILVEDAKVHQVAGEQKGSDQDTETASTLAVSESNSIESTRLGAINANATDSDSNNPNVGVSNDITGASNDVAGATIGSSKATISRDQNNLKNSLVENVNESANSTLVSLHDNSSGDGELNKLIQDSEILIRFSGDCWLKFTNGEGKTVFAALKREGQQVKYIGKTPFSIVLGDARQSTVTFNGQLMDLKPYTRKNGRAQFVLEP